MSLLPKLVAWLMAVAALPAGAVAFDALIDDVDKRLSSQGVEQVNAYLGDTGAFTLAALNDRTARCHLRAVGLSVQLARGSRSPVVDTHKDSLRIALGRCTGFVLALLTPTEVPALCSSVDAWTVSQTARELRRRIKSIEADSSLQASQRGRYCRAAYLYELQNTRVGLRVGAGRGQLR